jgi:hypothetical protein
MPDRDPDLLLKLAVHLDTARQLELQPRPTASRFGRGDIVERPWNGNDRLFIHATVTAVEVRYLIDEPVRRSWEHRFKPELTPEELFDWLISRL